MKPVQRWASPRATSPRSSWAVPVSWLVLEQLESIAVGNAAGAVASSSLLITFPAFFFATFCAAFKHFRQHVPVPDGRIPSLIARSSASCCTGALLFFWLRNAMVQRVHVLRAL